MDYSDSNNHTKRQEEHPVARQAAVAGAVAALPMQVYGDASPDINLTLHLPLTLDVPLDARCGYNLKVHSQSTFLM